MGFCLISYKKIWVKYRIATYINVLKKNVQVKVNTANYRC